MRYVAAHLRALFPSKTFTNLKARAALATQEMPNEYDDSGGGSGGGGDDD